jgi:hypothetical protein
MGISSGKSAGSFDPGEDAWRRRGGKAERDPSHPTAWLIDRIGSGH